jgi:hypothetical protein
MSAPQLIPSRLNSLMERLVYCALALMVAAGWQAGLPAGELSVVPEKLEFRDPFDRRQLLVQGPEGDVTRQVHYESSHPAVLTVDAAGFVVPRGGGQGAVVIRGLGRKSRFPFRSPGSIAHEPLTLQRKSCRS